MCIIIDADCLAAVCKDTSKQEEFRPVYNWVAFGEGKLVCGGSVYMEELGRAGSCLQFFVEMQKRQKVVRFSDDDVDHLQNEVESKLRAKNRYGVIGFDDPHIVALIGASGCKLLCTGDKNAFRFFKDKTYYPKHVAPPKLYTGKRNTDLLCRKNIATCCKRSYS